VIENIDIAGPSMVRSAQRITHYVSIVTDPADYGELFAALDESGGMTSRELRKRLGGKGFRA
jgi:phosphoribosylaminoimidazolecarboxamide formyltransferase/IMP cyclohydrolase